MQGKTFIFQDFHDVFCYFFIKGYNSYAILFFLQCNLVLDRLFYIDRYIDLSIYI